MLDKEKKDPTNRKYQTGFSGRDLRASSIGWELALPIVAGPVIGYLIDSNYQTGVTFTLIFLGLGLSVGIYNLIRFIVYEFSLIRTRDEEDKKTDERHTDDP